MSDRELEDWMKQQLDDGPSAELDARILAAGRRALQARRPRRVGPRPLLGLAAAVALLLAGGWWASSVWNSNSPVNKGYV